METFFTADTHFGHTNIINYCDRPFATKQEHDEGLIQNWNSVVNKKDHVYHLGDFGFGEIAYLKKLCQRLNGKIHLILGNHDKSSVVKGELAFRFTTIQDVHLYKRKFFGEKVEIFLSHYPHRSWPKAFHGSWHLFGHVHGNMEPYNRSFDVGVDCWDYTPISLDQVHEKIKTLENNMGV